MLQESEWVQSVLLGTKQRVNLSVSKCVHWAALEREREGARAGTVSLSPHGSDWLERKERKKLCSLLVHSLSRFSLSSHYTPPIWPEGFGPIWFMMCSFVSQPCTVLLVGAQYYLLSQVSHAKSEWEVFFQLLTRVGIYPQQPRREAWWDGDTDREPD